MSIKKRLAVWIRRKAQLTLYNKVWSSWNGSQRVIVSAREGRCLVYMPDLPEPAVVPDGYELAIDFSVLGHTTKNAPLQIETFRWERRA